MSTNANVGAVSVAESAKRLGVSHSTAKTLCRVGDLRSFRVGRRRLVSLAAIAEYIEEQEAKR